MVIERGGGVKRGQSEDAVGQHLMNFLRGMKHARIRSDAKIQLGESIVEDASMPDKGDDPENRDEDHQHVQKMVRRKRGAAIELANVRRQIRRLVRRPPHKSADDKREIDKPDAAMDVDPEWPRFLRDVVEQEAERSEKNDQRRDDPVKRDGGRAITCLRRGHALPGREYVHAIAPGFRYSSQPISSVRRLLQSPQGVFVARGRVVATRPVSWQAKLL